jgi:hypothetical protein
MWFWKREEPEDEFESDLSIRVAEIQSRIAALRSSLGGSAEPYQSTPSAQKLPQTSAVQSPDHAGHYDRTAKAEEMMALKAKLLGKKP